MMSSRELGFTANVDRQFLRAVNLLDLPLVWRSRFESAMRPIRSGFPCAFARGFTYLQAIALFTPITSTQSKVVFVTLWPLIRMRSRRLLP